MGCQWAQEQLQGSRCSQESQEMSEDVKTQISDSRCQKEMSPNVANYKKILHLLKKKKSHTFLWIISLIKIPSLVPMLVLSI